MKVNLPAVLQYNTYSIKGRTPLSCHWSTVERKNSLITGRELQQSSNLLEHITNQKETLLMSTNASNVNPLYSFPQTESSSTAKADMFHWHQSMPCHGCSIVSSGVFKRATIQSVVSYSSTLATAPPSFSELPQHLISPSYALILSR